MAEPSKNPNEKLVNPTSAKASPKSAPELSDDTLEVLQTVGRSDSPMEPDLKVVDEAETAPVPQAASNKVPKDLELDGLDHGVEELPDAPEPRKRPGWIKRFFAAYWRHKKWTLIVTLLVVLGTIAAVPWTRYSILGQFLTRPYSVVLQDAKTGKPVSGAKLTIEQETATTDAKGRVTLHAKVGKHQLGIDKKYYATYSKYIFVGIKKRNTPEVVQLVATGRQVPLTVVNKLTNKPIADVNLKAAGTEVKTDHDGKVTMVLPADQAKFNITVTSKGYNTLQGSVEVTEQESKQNTFALVPTGKLYFLSKQTGTIDVVKTDLDGTNRQTVLGGTGKEDDTSTQLLASRDWKYLALLSKRGSDPAKVYLISTDTDKLTTIDGSNSGFSLIGWSDHNFAFQSTRTAAKDWEANKYAIKTFNADNGQTLTLDQTQASGDQNSYQAQTFSNIYQLGNKIVYSVQWSGFYGQLADKQNSIRYVTLTGQKKDLKSFASGDYGYFQAQPYKPDEVYFAGYSNSQSKYDFFEVEAGDDVTIKTTTQDPNEFFQRQYATYLTSPSGNQTFWSESRDGKNVFFVGNATGDNGKQIADIDNDTVYGWYGDNYVLVSKNGSELFIMPAAGGTPFKVADYHKPAISLRGYGGGYGGL